jgi:mitogen-activated protein kinase 1/3
VYRATHLKTGIDVAIKYIKISDTNSLPLLRAIAREIEIMYRLTKISRNYFTVKLYDAFLPGHTKDADKLDSLYIVMDFTEYNLQKLYDSETKVQNEHVETLMYNILCALNFLKTSNIMHRDLKPSNILITPECNVKICDFGMARSVEEVDPSQQQAKHKKKRTASPVSFTRIYRPPEAILQCAKQTS